MRQVGVLAAAGLIALRDGDAGMITRLAEDHANARRLAEGLAGLDGIRSPGGIAQPGDGPLDPERAVTDFVLFKVDRDRAAFLDALEARGVRMVAVRARAGPRRDPLRHHRRGHRPHDRRGGRRPARDRAPAGG